MILNNTRLSIGTVGGKRWSGQIDEVAIFNRAISAEDVLALYAHGIEGHSDAQPSSIFSQALNYDAETKTFSFSGNLDEAGDVKLEIKDAETENIIDDQTVETETVEPFEFGGSVALQDPFPQLVMVTLPAFDLSGNETRGPTLILDTGISVTGATDQVTLPESSVHINTNGNVAPVSGFTVDGRPVVAINTSSEGGPVGAIPLSLERHHP